MQEFNNVIRHTDQTLIMVKQLRDQSVPYKVIAEALNDAGAVRPNAKDAYTDKTVANMMYQSYPAMLRRNKVEPTQVIDLNKVIENVKGFFKGSEDD